MLGVILTVSLVIAVCIAGYMYIKFIEGMLDDE